MNRQTRFELLRPRTCRQRAPSNSLGLLFLGMKVQIQSFSELHKAHRTLMWAPSTRTVCEDSTLIVKTRAAFPRIPTSQQCLSLATFQAGHAMGYVLRSWLNHDSKGLKAQPRRCSSSLRCCGVEAALVLRVCHCPADLLHLRVDRP